MLCHRPYGNTGVTELYRRGRQDAQPSVDYQVPIFGGKIAFKATANRAAECIVVGVAEHTNQVEIERSRGAALKSSRIRRHPNNSNYSSNLSKWSTFCSVRSGALGEARRRMHSNATAREGAILLRSVGRNVPRPSSVSVSYHTLHEGVGRDLDFGVRVSQSVPK
uniref:Uncharacterized protein n=1 Tax=Anopheles coluzzii TaxID=1518534 RepID=A0A6E8VBI2_ANOCL